jgi:rSAM/selenodomain-associated transferase 1
MTARSGRHLVIFTRQPRLGSGKRRLAQDIGQVAALRFQRAMLSLLLRRLGRDRRWITWLAVTPDRARPWPARLPVVPQGQGDVGLRMGRVARMLPRGAVVIVGSDIPGITAGDIALAFKALGHRDAVFGPASDGGYWLVGLRRRPRLLIPFDGVRWSSEHALKDTLANLAGRPVGLLRQLTDIDDGAAFSRARNWRALHGYHHR